MRQYKLKNDKIFALKGPDRVRLQPGVFFGSDGIEGATRATKVVFDLFATEAMLGYSNRIDITIHEDNSISVYSKNRGLIISETLYDDLPEWHYDFCELYARPGHTDDYTFLSSFYCRVYMFDKSEKPFQKYPLDDNCLLEISSTQCASEFMEIVSIRDKQKKRLVFRKGYNTSDLVKETTTEDNSTLIHFKPDPEVFTDVNFPIDVIRDLIRERAVCIPGVEYNLRDERTGINETYSFPEGIEGYTKFLASPQIPLFVKEIEASGKDRYNRKEYEARIKIYLGFSPENAKTFCFHNYRILQFGGHHLDKVKERLSWCISEMFYRYLVDDSKLTPEERGKTRDRYMVSFEVLSNHIVLILESNCSEFASCWTNATRKAITNRMITDMAIDLIGDEFDDYLRKNHIAILNSFADIISKLSK